MKSLRGIYCNVSGFSSTPFQIKWFLRLIYRFFSKFLGDLFSNYLHELISTMP